MATPAPIAPPDGFELDEPTNAPPALPDGFILDNAPANQPQQTEAPQPSFLKRWVFNPAGSALKYVGNVARGAGTDIVNTTTAPITEALYGDIGYDPTKSNFIEAIKGNSRLPVDVANDEIAKTHPYVAVASDVAQGALATTPFLLLGGAPALVQKATALGFAADQIKNVGQLATDYGTEMGKNPQDRDPAKLAQLRADLIQTGVFAPLAGTAGASKLGNVAAEKFLPENVAETLTKPRSIFPSIAAPNPDATAPKFPIVDANGNPAPITEPTTPENELHHGDTVNATLPNGKQVNGTIIGADENGNAILFDHDSGQKITLPEKTTIPTTGEPNALRQPQAGEIFQRQPQATGSAGSERKRNRSGQQGTQAAAARPTQESELPEGVEVIKPTQPPTPPVATGQLTPEASQLLKSGGVPAFVTKNLEKIARDNGVEPTGKNPNQIIAELKAKQSQPPKSPLGRQPSIRAVLRLIYHLN